jgi:L-threonylcarbamoyladenylate synthase
MPSANISGKPSATSASHVETDFGADFPVLDGGQCPHGLESTILYWEGTQWVLVRLGAIPPELFVEVLGYLPEARLEAGSAPLSPGQKYRHYAPRASLHLVDSFDDNDEGVVVGFNGRRYPPRCKLYLLGDISMPEEVAANLYAVLRQLDDDGIAEASIDFNLPNNGLWKTIKERIKKASH